MYFNEAETNRKIKKLVSKPRKYKSKLKLWGFRLAFFACVALLVSGVSLGIGVFKGILKSAPKVTAQDVQPSGFASIIYDNKKKEIQKLSSFESNREEVSSSDIPEHLKNAFIAIEDSRFYEHNGIDIKGIARAAFQAVKTRDFSQGASTITQQLIKNNVFNMGNESTLVEKVERKIQEQFAAVQLEKEMSKDDILLAYLNTINLGEGTLGVEAASETYFGKTVSDLTLSESAVIASITQNPSRYNPVYNPKDNATRRAVTLKYMLNDHMITKKEYDEALADDVYSRIQEVSSQKKTKDNSSYTYFVDALIKEIVNDLKQQLGYNETQAYNLIYSGGLSIYSTQDTAIQKICDTEFNDDANYASIQSISKYSVSYQLTVTHKDESVTNYSERDLADYLGKDKNKTMFFANKEEGKQKVEEFRDSVVKKSDTYLDNLTFTIQPQFSFSFMDQTNGEVLALVGGRGGKTGNLTLNRATDTTRQPGSTFKVISTFVPALDTAGKTLATVYDDCPYNYENSSKPVKNYYHGYRGLSSIRSAIRDSMNIVTAKCMADVTPQTGYDYLTNMGISTLVEKETTADGNVFSDITQTLCLGGITRGVTNLELTAAYASIANKGEYNKPILYDKILDHSGNVLLDNTKNKGTKVMKESTSWLITNAMKDVVNSGTGTAANLGTGMAVAGKTGTTSDDLDHWFVGFTPYYTAGVWSGVDSNESFLTNGIEKQIWAKIMNAVNEKKKKEIKDFPACSDIVSASICTKCGKLAVQDLCTKTDAGSQVKTEYFTSDTVPTEKCDCHIEVEICEDSGLLATDNCPNIIKKILLIKPSDAIGTTSDSAYYAPDKTCKIHTSDSNESDEEEEFNNQDTSNDSIESNTENDIPTLLPPDHQ